MRILQRRDYRRMAWKNGGGETEEVAIAPADSAMDRCHWRLSIAHVTADGPFSALPGLDRSILLLEGGGLDLHFPGGRKERLTVDGPPLAFAGEDPVEGRNRAGPTLDLNIMTRRGVMRHAMARRGLSSAGRLEAAGDIALFLALTPCHLASAPDAPGEPPGQMLQRLDTVMLAAGEGIDIRGEEALAFVAIDLWACGSTAFRSH